MLFTSLQWILLVTAVFLLYHLISPRYRRWVMLGASLLFYASWSVPYVSLLMAHILVDWTCGHFLSLVEKPRPRKIIVAVSVVLNLSSLLLFKFYGLFHDTLAQLSIQVPAIALTLPLGISFFAFESMSYTVDVYRGRTRAWKSPLDLSLFVTWFPHLIAGPIIRPSEMKTQLDRQPSINRERFFSGLHLMASGYAKKLLIADWLAKVVDPAFVSPSAYSSFELTLAVYAYAFQVYCDFSAYTDIARGASRWFGIELPENFDHPYQSTSVTEFWRRWHMTLSRWLKDYLYIPLGGNRKGRFRTYLNLMITMLLGGLWHGSSWTFLAWGGLQGAYLIIERACGIRPGGDVRGLSRIFRQLLTFHLICFGYIFFRSGSFDKAWQILLGIFAGTRPMSSTALSHGVGVALLIAGYWGGCWLKRKTSSFDPGDRWHKQLAYVACFAAAIFLFVFCGASSNAFIYFQF